MGKNFILSLSVLIAVVCFSFFVTAVFAEDTSEEPDNLNLLGNYTSADWSGNTLYLDEPSTAVYFKKISDNNKQSAVLTFKRDKSDTGFYFRIDVGNGANSGGDSGFCTLSFYGEGREQLLSLSTGLIQNFDNYSRFYIGEETSYFPIPEGTETVEVVLNAEQNGKGERINIYFRNLSLHLSGEKPLLPDEKKLYLESTAGLTKVEIGLTPFTRYIWIGIVFFVALAFYIVRIWKQKYSSPKVMKSTDRKIK